MSKITHTISADEALQLLKDGNERFLNGTARFPTNQKEVLASLATGQHPYATIIGCSDSRVPPELIFDANFGDLFVIRNAGNVVGNIISPEIGGSLQYAGMHLATPLYVILGHEGCGAIKAAVEYKFRSTPIEPRIELLLQIILPCLENVDPLATPAEQIKQAVEANVRAAIQQILKSPEGRFRKSEGIFKLVGAICDTATGKVRFLESD